MTIDYASALADDFGSDSDSDGHDSGSQTNLNTSGSESSQQLTKQVYDSLDLLLRHTKDLNVDRQLQLIDPKTRFAVAELSCVSGNMAMVRQELTKYADKFNVDYMELASNVSGSTESEEYMFLMSLSKLPDVISKEIVLLHRYVAARYNQVFPELESLVANSIDYCKIVHTIGPDLDQIRTHNQFLNTVVSGEKVLAITMAAIQQARHSNELHESSWSNLRDAAVACVDLGSFMLEVSDFIADKLSKYAPNVSALVGQTVASQLIVSTGSLKDLAATPSCNLPSLGVRDLLSQQRNSITHIRSTGYLYHCPLINELPPEIIKQALRIVSGKTILAARIDVSRSSPGGELGIKYRQEVQVKLDKLLLPPDQTGPKALPVPQERKSKKRAGRRFRKMRERFNMSELRKAQNKMEFGKEERTVTDAFGEEIGLGLTREIVGAQINRNTDARLSKAMIHRLQKQKEKDSIEAAFMSSNGSDGSTNKKGVDDGNGAPKKRPRII